METLLLVINIILAVILVLLVLLQKSEGGALGIGVSQENFMLSRSAGSFMTKATAIVATLFIICSLALQLFLEQNLVLRGRYWIQLSKKLKIHLQFQKIIN